MPLYQLGLSVEKASLLNIFLKNEIGQPSNSWVVPERQESRFSVENEERHPWPQHARSWRSNVKARATFLLYLQLLPNPLHCGPAVPLLGNNAQFPTIPQKGLANWPKAWSSPVLFHKGRFIEAQPHLSIYVLFTAPPRLPGES